MTLAGIIQSSIAVFFISLILMFICSIIIGVRNAQYKDTSGWIITTLVLIVIYRLAIGVGIVSGLIWVWQNI